MKKFAVICIIALLLTCALPVSATENKEDMSATNGCSTLDARMPLMGTGELVDNAKSVLLYETSTDTLLYAYQADTPLSPASFVKILTALIAIEKGQLDIAVTVRAEVLDTLPYDAMVVNLVAGEVLSVEDLLYCMMVGSGNDAAAVLADHISGSQQAFVDEMNAYAANLGCTNTNFTNAHGLHNENQYTTARDSAKILSHALQNETFCEVFGTVTYTVPATNKSEERKLTTQNHLQNPNDEKYYDSRVTGGRTGTANDRTRSVASVAKTNGLNLICIVMGCQTQYASDGYTVKTYGGYPQTTELLDLAGEGYQAVRILHPDQVLNQFRVEKGDALLSVAPKDSLSAVIPVDYQKENLNYRYIDMQGLSAPIEKGQIVGCLQIWCDTICIAQTDLVSLNAVVIKGNQIVDDNRSEQGSPVLTLILTVFSIGLAIFLLIIAPGAIKRMLWSRKRRAKNRRNRVRSR